MRMLAISLCLLACGCIPPVEDVVKPAPVVDTHVEYQPNPAIQERLKPVTVALSVNKSDAEELGSFYLAMGDLIEADSAVLQSTGQIRTALASSGSVMFGSRLKGKYPGLSQTVDSFLMEMIDSSNVPLSAELRSKAADAMRSLGWACMEAAK